MGPPALFAVFGEISALHFLLFPGLKWVLLALKTAGQAVGD